MASLCPGDRRVSDQAAEKQLLQLAPALYDLCPKTHGKDDGRDEPKRAWEPRREAYCKRGTSKPQGGAWRNVCIEQRGFAGADLPTINAVRFRKVYGTFLVAHLQGFGRAGPPSYTLCLHSVRYLSRHEHSLEFRSKYSRQITGLVHKLSKLLEVALSTK